MKLKKMSFATLSKDKIYLSSDLQYMYIVQKMYSDKNITVDIYSMSEDNGYPQYSIYKKYGQINLSHEPNRVIEVFDLGKRSPYKKIENMYIVESIYKSIEKFCKYLEKF